MVRPDRQTLAARIILARQVGATGNPRQALTIAREVDAAATAALGADDQTTLSARFEVAVWTREVDGAAEEPPQPVTTRRPSYVTTRF